MIHRSRADIKKCKKALKILDEILSWIDLSNIVEEERLRWLTNQAQNSTLRWLVIGFSSAIGMVNLLDKPKTLIYFTIYQLLAILIMICYERILSKMGDIISWRDDLNTLGMPSAPSEDNELSKCMDRTINFLNEKRIIKLCIAILFLIIADLVYGIKFL